MSDSFARPTLAGAPAAAPRAMPKDAAHPFAGRHLVVSYLGCDVGALSDHRVTCGYNCKGEKFDEVLRAYLRPQEVAIKTFLRSNDVVDDLAGQDSRPSPRPPVPEPARAP